MDDDRHMLLFVIIILATQVRAVYGHGPVSR